MNRFFGVFLVFLLSVPAVMPLFSSGYFSMHDDTQVTRVIEMGNALIQGQFPVRWVSNLGYGFGYPIFNFYGPLPYYFGGILYALGVPALLATKMMFGFGLLIPSITMYLVLVGILGNLSALVGSIFYLYAPYHAVQVYVRGSVGEYWMLMFWPLLLRALWNLGSKDSLRGTILLGAIGLSGAILSHTLMGYVTVLIFTFIVLLMLFIKKNRTKTAGIILLLGLSISAFFWLPAFVEMPYTNVASQVSDSANFHDHFVCVSQLWSSMWGFGGSAKGCVDGMSFMLGKIHILAAVIVLLAFLFRLLKIHRKFIASILMFTAFSLYLALPLSRFVWEFIPFFSYLQYPWRFLAVAGFGLSVLAGFLPVLIKDLRLKVLLTILLIGGVVALNTKWFVPQFMVNTTSSDYESLSDIRFRVSKISDEYLPPTFIKPKYPKDIAIDTIQPTSGVLITPLNEEVVYSRFVVETSRSAQLIINKAWFPGWVYTINNKEVEPQINAGIVSIAVGEGQSIVTMQFKDTPIRILGNLLSLLGLLALFGIVYGKQTKTKR